MNPTIREYQRLRSLVQYGDRPIPAAQALEAARWRIRHSRAWSHAEAAGLVKIEVEPDYCCDLGDLEGDMYRPECHPGHPGGARDLAAQRARFVERIERDGVVGFVGYYRVRPDAEWQVGDSLWGIEGDTSPHDLDGPAMDVQSETLDALADALRNRCSRCRRAAA